MNSLVKLTGVPKLLRFLFVITTHKGSWNPRLLISEVITASTLTSEVNLSEHMDLNAHDWLTQVT